MEKAIHPTAIVEDGAVLGAGVEIGPFCIVGPKVKLGEGVRLLSHVVIARRDRKSARAAWCIRARCWAANRKSAATTRPEHRLVIGEDYVIRECVSISLGSAKGHGVTEVGARGFFMAYSHIGHDCRVGNDVTFANGAQLAGHVDIGDGVVLGGLAAVQQFTRIGRGAMLGGISGANNDIIPYAMAIGMHSKLTGLNIVGLKRRGVPRANIHALRAAFRAIFLEPGGSVKELARGGARKMGRCRRSARDLRFHPGAGQAPDRRRASARPSRSGRRVTPARSASLRAAANFPSPLPRACARAGAKSSSWRSTAGPTPGSRTGRTNGFRSAKSARRSRRWRRTTAARRWWRDKWRGRNSPTSSSTPKACWWRRA